MGKNAGGLIGDMEGMMDKVTSLTREPALNPEPLFEQIYGEELLNDARSRAKKEPLRLPKNRFTAALFIGLWIGIFSLIAFLAFRKFAV